MQFTKHSKSLNPHSAVLYGEIVFATYDKSLGHRVAVRGWGYSLLTINQSRKVRVYQIPRTSLSKCPLLTTRLQSSLLAIHALPLPPPPMAERKRRQDREFRIMFRPTFTVAGVDTPKKVRPSATPHSLDRSLLTSSTSLLPHAVNSPG